MKPQNFKIRASSCSKLMGARGMGKTGEAYAKHWALSQYFGRTAEIQSKYLQKGIIMEEEALDSIEQTQNLGLVLKNETWFEGEFFTGTPDNIQSDFIIDVKCPWDWTTFPLYDVDVKIDYYWQMQCYMHLTGRKLAKVCFVLLDTPFHLIEKEARSYSFANGYGELSQEMYESFVKKMTYSDIPIERRIKIFDIEADPEAVKKIIERVTDARNYLETLK